VSFPSSTGPFKLEADTQEFEPTGFDNEGVECPSTSAAETLRESSNSSLSPERQNLSEGVSSRISTSLLEFDSLEVDSDDEEAEAALSIDPEKIGEISSYILPSENRPLGISLNASSESNSQELDRNYEGVEGLSTSSAETLRETLGSFLSPEHQNQSEDASLWISTSLLEFDSSEVYSDKEEAEQALP
ncbi:hypothetical protein QYM36_008816, partial [Artemia franciscana]